MSLPDEDEPSDPKPMPIDGDTTADKAPAEPSAIDPDDKRGMGDRGMGDRGMGDRGVNERGMGDRGMGDR